MPDAEIELEFEIDEQDIEVEVETETSSADIELQFNAFTDKYVEKILPGQNINVTNEGKVYTVNSTLENLSELNDDIGFNNLQMQVNNLQQSENTEMEDIVSLITRRTENMIDFNNIEQE